jgi:hypothetical protein
VNINAFGALVRHWINFYENAFGDDTQLIMARGFDKFPLNKFTWYRTQLRNVEATLASSLFIFTLDLSNIAIQLPSGMLSLSDNDAILRIRMFDLHDSL